MAGTPSTTTTTRLLADAVHAFLVDLDPARASSVTDAERASHLGRARSAAGAVTSSWDAVPEAQRDDPHLRQSVDQLARALHDAGTPSTDGAWLNLRDRLSPFYESLVTALRRHGDRAPTLHPTNHRRTLFHVLSGLAVVAAFELVLTRTSAVVVAASAAGILWTLEAIRFRSPAANVVLMKLFKPVARDHERYRVNSSTWYSTAMLLIALTAPNAAGMLGITALAVGDPAAGWVGRRFGRVRIFGGKSVEGTAAFAAMSMLCGLAYLALSGHGPSTAGAWIAWTAAASVAGALTELFASRVDDNLAVPVMSAWAVLLVQGVTG